MRDMSDDLLSVAEVAERLSVSGATVRRWIGQGRLGAVRAGGQWRIPRADLGEFILESTDAATPERYRQPEYAVMVKPR
jgi:excisionase family DNA binding protein